MLLTVVIVFSVGSYSVYSVCQLCREFQRMGWSGDSSTPLSKNEFGLSFAESKKGKEPRNQVPRKVSESEEGLEGFNA